MTTVITDEIVKRNKENAKKGRRPDAAGRLQQAKERARARREATKEMTGANAAPRIKSTRRT